MTVPNGLVQICCVASDQLKDENQNPYYLDKTSLLDIWNSTHMREIRKKMLGGESVKGCEICYSQDQLGKNSFRQRNNDYWLSRLGSEKFTSLVEESAQVDFENKSAPAFLDLRMGNKCNLKCRTCNPYNSVQIEKEYEQLNTESDGEYKKFWKKNNFEFFKFEPWFEDQNFWLQLESFVPQLQRLYLTGGEPTLIEGNYKLMNLCIEQNRAKDIEIVFNINFTNLPEEFLKAIEQFKSATIVASIDAYGDLNDYIRSGSKWKKIEENLEIFLKNKTSQISLGFSPVVQSYNILKITELFSFIEDLSNKYEESFFVDTLFCYAPDFMDFIYLPRDIKLQAIESIKSWKTKSERSNSSLQNDIFNNSVESLLRRLEESLDLVNSEKLKQLAYYTKTLDKKRNTSIDNHFPEFKDIL